MSTKTKISKILDNIKIKDLVKETVKNIAMPPPVCVSHSIVADKLEREEDNWTEEELLALIHLALHWGRMLQRGGDLKSGMCVATNERFYLGQEVYLGKKDNKDREDS
jgi:hypothetical protein